MDSNQNSSLTNRESVSSHQTKVLLMDTCVVNKKLISKILGKIGYPVVCAENHKDALKILDNDQIELILLDVKLSNNGRPDITQIAKEKEKASGRRIPIVLLTDSEIKVHREACMADGLDECLPKPIFEMELCRVIETLTGNNGRCADKT